ncbi:MAG: sugar phosphate isomerase/epimerase [Clostridia bacterium]|nr:sugar phosphate isomerase/epimerase [Clostridia bacterium]
MRIGAQLFTVREYTKTLESFSETLKKVADIGYKTVQVSGTCAFDPAWLAEELKSAGLECAITHYDRDLIKNDPVKVAKDHDAFGCKYVGIGSMPRKDGAFISEEDHKAFVRDFIPVAKTLKENGKYLMYHNHQIEFAKSADGRIYLKRLIEDFPAELMGFTLDVYWAQVGGGDVIDWIDKLHGRVPCVHLKDLTIEKSKQLMAPVGYGNLNMEAIVRACYDSGTQYLLVEQDDCYGEDPFDCLKKSYNYLKGLGL